MRETSWQLDRTRAAILFERFGPYHHARLNAAGQFFDVWGIEACASETVYAWKKVEGAEKFRRVTLTELNTNDQRWKKELIRSMWQSLDKIKPHIVVLPGWSSCDALSALAWCVKNHIPAVVMSESTAWDDQRVFWKEWIKSRLVKCCQAGLAGGTPHADYLVQLGLPRERIFLGYDIVDNDFFKHQSQKARAEETSLRKKQNLPSKFFLASARFVEKKNLFGLIRAYARYCALAKTACRSEIWDLVLLGDGALKPALCQLISELGMTSRIHLPGFKQYDELPVYFGLAEAFFHASTVEQWGLVVNEAMASGLPVLVSNRCGCATDLVHEGVNGFKFDPYNVEDIALRLLQVSALTPLQRSAMGEASQCIIAGWGPERFSQGLRDAATLALKNSHRRFRFFDRLILQLLLLR